MSAYRIGAIVLIVAGALGLAYGRFSYTEDTHRAEMGPMSVTVRDKRTVNVPMWAGVGAIVIGGLMLATAGRGSRS